mmetsp:Transcript_55154/g.120964  ORF Transcript_55154/g.120964 Transcript_55154/m.120964 type:complete len:347 (-) Transcript_55154:57-1097(-)
MDMMDSESASTAISAGLGLGSAAETFLCVIVAMVVLRLELQRRAGNGPDFGSRDPGRYAESCKRLLRQCAPEAAGVVACLTLAAALRARGDSGRPLDDQAWASITAQWPLLLTADTLLSLQAMLRLVVLLSVVLRASGGGPVPLSEEASTMWLMGGLARACLLIKSTVYMLDGPLGGALPAACEVAVLPLLLVLSRGTLRRAPATIALLLPTVGYFCYRNRLALAEDCFTDGLFMFAHVFDLLAALAYLLRTLLIDTSSKGGRGGVSVGFAHLVMPVQQSLSAYYFLQAFDIVPELVGSGLPFEVLQIGNTVQFGAYLGALALHLAECFEARGGPDAGQSFVATVQ